MHLPSISDSSQSEPLLTIAIYAALPATAENGPMILKYSILNGALELLPESIATMAILPLQQKALQMHGTYLPEIQERARTLNTGTVLDLVRGNTQL